MKQVISSSLIIVAVLTGCKKNLQPNDYIRYVQDKQNGLKKEVIVDGWQYDIQYRPYEYILLFEQAGDLSKSSKRLAELSGTAWFNISFKRTSDSVSAMRYGLSSKEDYDRRVDYYLNQASKDLVLVYDKRDTLHPISYEFENNYNLTPQETIVVGFGLPKGEKEPRRDMQLCWTDHVFKNGIIKALYLSDELRKIPNLTLN